MTAGYTALVVAKAPVAGQAKTRLGAHVGDDRAAAVAAAALLDTLEAVNRCGATRRVLALTGDLTAGAGATEIAGALTGWVVVPQRGDGFDERLAAAHADAGPGPVVQVGMDTPQVTAALLDDVAAALAGHDAVLGEAADGGWWVLALHDPSAAEALRGIAMSTPTTHDDTRAALLRRGLRVAGTSVLRDVDEPDDADDVADRAPHTHFARAWRGLEATR